MLDRHAALPEALQRSVFDARGSLAPEVRRALATGGAAPAALAEYARVVRDTAYLVGDEDVTAVIDAGYTEDQVYEATVATALGAGVRRLDIGLRALADSLAITPEVPRGDGEERP